MKPPRDQRGAVSLALASGDRQATRFDLVINDVGGAALEEYVVMGPQTAHLRLRLERKYVSSAPKKTIIDA